MIVTCHDCPRRLAFAGTAESRAKLAAAFGWVARPGEGFLCPPCGTCKQPVMSGEVSP